MNYHDLLYYEELVLDIACLGKLGVPQLKIEPVFALGEDQDWNAEFS